MFAKLKIFLFFYSEQTKKINSVANVVDYFFPHLRMATLRYKKKLTAINRDFHKEHSWNNETRVTNIPRNQEDFITQVPEEIEDRVTKKLYQKFSRKKSCVLGTLSMLNDCLRYPLGRHPGTQNERAKKRMRIVLRKILILKWVSLWGGPLKNSAQTRLPRAMELQFFYANNSSRVWPEQK